MNKTKQRVRDLGGNVWPTKTVGKTLTDCNSGWIITPNGWASINLTPPVST